MNHDGSLKRTDQWQTKGNLVPVDLPGYVFFKRARMSPLLPSPHASVKKEGSELQDPDKSTD
jgi:hypothetical protein